MRDHTVPPVSHSFEMHNPLPNAQVLEFLREGRFDCVLTFADALRRVLKR